MGSSASKGARSAGATLRKYPSKVSSATTRPAPAPPAPPATPAPTRASQTPPQPSAHNLQAIDPNIRDPGLASRLHQLGAVDANPYASNSSSSPFDPQHTSPADFHADNMMQAPPQSAFPGPRDNPALRVLAARSRIADEAEGELEHLGRRDFEGRKYLEAGTITLALMRRKRGEGEERVERAFGLRKGRLGVLGTSAVVDSVA